jgi:hypothetical protein
VAKHRDEDRGGKHRPENVARGQRKVVLRNCGSCGGSGKNRSGNRCNGCGGTGKKVLPPGI